MRSITARPGERVAAERFDDLGRADHALLVVGDDVDHALEGQARRGSAMVASSAAGLSAIALEPRLAARGRRGRGARAGRGARGRESTGVEHGVGQRFEAVARASTSPRRRGRASARTARWRARAAGAAGRRARPSAHFARRVAARVALRLGRELQPDLRGLLLHELGPATRTGPLAPTLAPAAAGIRGPARYDAAAFAAPASATILSRTCGRRFVVVRELHVELALAAGHARELARVLEHLRHRDLGAG